eukprot:1160877-Pelagomonas_calceolata.AAC.2
MEAWEEALESGRRGPENKEAHLSRRGQTLGRHLKTACCASCASCTSSWAHKGHGADMKAKSGHAANDV